MAKMSFFPLKKNLRTFEHSVQTRQVLILMIYFCIWQCFAAQQRNAFRWRERYSLSSQNYKEEFGYFFYFGPFLVLTLFCSFFMYFGTPCTCCNQHATTPFPSTLQTNARGGWGCSRPTRVNKLEMQTPICQQKRRTLSLSLFSRLTLSIFRPSWLLHCWWWKGSAFVSRRAPSPTVGTVV